MQYRLVHLYGKLSIFTVSLKYQVFNKYHEKYQFFHCNAIPFDQINKFTDFTEITGNIKFSTEYQFFHCDAIPFDVLH